MTFVTVRSDRETPGGVAMKKVTPSQLVLAGCRWFSGDETHEPEVILSDTLPAAQVETARITPVALKRAAEARRVPEDAGCDSFREKPADRS